jgi:hypothetical protein
MRLHTSHHPSLTLGSGRVPPSVLHAQPLRMWMRVWVAQQGGRFSEVADAATATTSQITILSWRHSAMLCALCLLSRGALQHLIGSVAGAVVRVKQTTPSTACNGSTHSPQHTSHSDAFLLPAPLLLLLLLLLPAGQAPRGDVPLSARPRHSGESSDTRVARGEQTGAAAALAAATTAAAAAAAVTC